MTGRAEDLSEENQSESVMCDSIRPAVLLETYLPHLTPTELRAATEDVTSQFLSSPGCC